MAARQSLQFKASQGNPGTEILEDVTIDRELLPLQMALHLGNDALVVRSTLWKRSTSGGQGLARALLPRAPGPACSVTELSPRPKGTPGRTDGWAKLFYTKQWPSPGKTVLVQDVAAGCGCRGPRTLPGPRVFCHHHRGPCRLTWRLHKRHGWLNRNGSQRVHPNADLRFRRRVTERSPRPATSAGDGGPTPVSWSPQFSRRSVPSIAFLVTAHGNGETVRAKRSQVSQR